MRKVIVVAMLMATIVGCGNASSEKRFPSVTINPSMETQESLVEQDATQEATIEDTVESRTESVEESSEEMTESVREESTVEETTVIETEQESSFVEESEQESSVEGTTIEETIHIPTTEVEESTTIMQEETTQQETTVEQTTVEETTQQQTTQVPTTQAPHEHEFKETAKTDATCSENGSIHYSCDCGHSYTESIPATGTHNWYLIASGKKNFYACSICVVASYEEDNPDWVSVREATIEEKQACLNAINAERAKSGYCELYLCEGYGSQEWANYLAENKVYEHDQSVFWTHDEGCGGAYTPEEAGVDQSYTCLGLAADDGDDYYATDPYIDIGMAYSNEDRSYFYCIRHKITY